MKTALNKIPTRVQLFVSAVIILSLGISLFSAPTHYKTNRMEQLTAELADNSVVKLNSESTVTLVEGFNKDHRKVAITGEVFFAVQEGSFPFVVTTEGAEIRVRGTQFIVRSRNHKVRIVVKEGRVEVLSTLGQQDQIVTLTERQSISFNKGELPNKSQKTGTEYYFAWIYGKIGFYRADLEHAAEEIERRFDVTVQFTNTANQKETITGVFEANDVDSVLTAICQPLHMKYYEVENGVYEIY